MRIKNDDLHNKASFDEAAYGAFLRELGIPQARRESLEVWFVQEMPDASPGAAGDYRSQPPRIRVCTKNGDGERYGQAILNHMVLHETRHFQQDVERGYCYAPGEEQLPHDARPAEVDTSRFARQHRHRCFVHLPLTERMVLFSATLSLTRTQKVLLAAMVALEVATAIVIDRAIRGGAA